MCWPGRNSGHFRRWLHVDDNTFGPSNRQLHLISGEFFHGTDLLRRSAIERRQQDELAMEGLKTLQPDTSSPAFEIQATLKGSVRPNSSGKLLQLTPLWEHVVRNQQVPPDIDKNVLFAELAARLCDLEWEVRGHALRVLVDLIPVMEMSELDRYMMPVLLRELTYNLGHSAPSVRKGALDTLGVYLSHSTDPETVLRNIVVEGLEKQTLTSSAKGNVAMGVILSIPSLVSPLLTPTNGIVLISQTGLVHLVSALSKKLVQDTYQKQSLKTLVKIREMVGEARFDRFLEGFHPQCKKDFDILCQVYDVRMNLGDSGIDLHVPLPGEDLLFEGNDSNTGHSYWSDDSTPAVYPRTISPEDAVFRDLNQNVVFLDDKSSSSDNMPDETDGVGSVNHLTETVTEKCGRGEAIESGYRNFRELYSGQTSAIQGVSSDRNYAENGGENLELEIEERSVSPSENKDYEEKSVAVMEADPLEEGTVNFSRVVLETEIKLNEEAAIMMSILEERNTSPQEELSDETGAVSNGEEYPEDKEPAAYDEYRMYNNFIMKILTDDEDYNDDDDVAVPDQPIRRTPRRVRFGGEVVMMRTPDGEDTAAQQEDSDINSSQENVNEGYSDSENGVVKGNTEDSSIGNFMPDTRRDSANFFHESSRRELASCARSSSRGQSAAQETLSNANQNTLEGSRRDSMASRKQGTVTEIKHDSEDATGLHSIQDSYEGSQRVSVHEAKQETSQFGPNGDVIGKPSVQGSLDDTKCGPDEVYERDTVINGTTLTQRTTQMFPEHGRCFSTDAGRHDCAGNVAEQTTEDAKQSSTEDATKERIRNVMESVTEAQNVGQKDAAMSSCMQSHIPLPLVPARNKPRDHKRRVSLYRRQQNMRESETSTKTQSSDVTEGTRAKQGSGVTVNGAESDGRETTVREPEESERLDDFSAQDHTDQNWEKLGIVTESVLEDLHDQVSRI
jgi:hypothetical protein